MPGCTAVCGAQDSQSVVRICRTIGFACSHQHNAMGRIWIVDLWLDGNRTHGQRGLIVDQGCPNYICGIETCRVAGLPDAAKCSTQVNGIAARVRAVDHDGCGTSGDPTIILLSEAARIGCQWSWPERLPHLRNHVSCRYPCLCSGFECWVPQ